MAIFVGGKVSFRLNSFLFNSIYILYISWILDAIKRLLIWLLLKIYKRKFYLNGPQFTYANEIKQIF